MGLMDSVHGGRWMRTLLRGLSGLGCSSVAGHVLSTQEALGSILSTTKNKTKRKLRKWEGKGKRRVENEECRFSSKEFRYIQGAENGAGA